MRLFRPSNPGSERVMTFFSRFETSDSVKPCSENRPRTMRAVMLGCGVVNGGVLGHLPEAVKVNAIVTRRPRDFAGAVGLTELGAAFDTGPDLVIEALPDGEFAEKALAKAVECGAHIVSANKSVIARRPDLEAAAAKQGAGFYYSAAVGGGVPVLETIERLREAGLVIRAVRGVVNGTTNYVLDAIAEGATREAAIADAQAAGFAEADPTADIDGGDAAAKLCLIGRKAFDIDLPPHRIPADKLSRLDAVTIQGAARRGLRYRQCAEIRRGEDGPLAAIRLEALAEDHPLARPRREENVFEIECEDGLTLTLHGKGAGRAPTAGAVLGDIAALIRREART